MTGSPTEIGRQVSVGVGAAVRDRAALRWAAAEAVSRQLALRVVHAYEWRPGPVWTGRLRPVPDSVLDEVRLAAEAELAAAVAECQSEHPTLTVTGGLVEGPAASVLHEASRTAELLVLGTGSRPGPAGGIGSIGQSAVERSACPVVVVRDRPPAPGRPSRVVVGLDLEHDSHGPLAFAFDQARRWDCTLEAVTCWLPYLLDAQSLLKSAPAEDQASVQQRLADQLQPWREKYPAVEAVGTVSQQRPASGLLERGSGHDLLVLGRPGSHPMRAALGSVQLAVLRHADCPVALVPTDQR